MPSLEVKVLDPLDQVAVIEVWEPRWDVENSVRNVYLACYKIDRMKVEHVKVVFTKAKDLAGDWYVSRKYVRRRPKVSNGVIECYEVPLSKLQPIEYKKVSKYI